MFQNLRPLATLDKAAKFVKPMDARFATDLETVEVSATELGELLVNYPLAFQFSGDTAVIVAVLTVMPGTNFFVKPDGSWGAGYVPKQVAAWPFALYAPVGTDTARLCIAESQLREGPEEGFVQTTDIFNGDGSEGADLAKARGILEAFYRSLLPTRKGVAMLNAAGLFEPWPLEIERDSQKTVTQGLWRINEQALQSLDPQSLSSLATQGALGLAYAQILSQSRLDVLQVGASAHAKALEAKKRLDEELTQTFGDGDSNKKLDFDF